MDVQPIHRAKRPHYPTQPKSPSRGSWLARHLPRSWKKIAAIGGGAALLVAGAIAYDRMNPGAIVAPLFEHGKGRAATGCVVTAPPVFLSEEEALQIIRDELARHGLTMAAPGPGRTGTVGLSSDPLDLVDAEGKVMVEFVSQADTERLVGDGNSFWTHSTVSSYDFRKAGKVMRARLRSRGPVGHAGVFYDPANSMPSPRSSSGSYPVDPEDIHKAWEKARVTAADKSKDELRQQVADFAVWLKKQGVL